MVAGFAQHSLEMFASVIGTWLPLSLAFLVTWALGVAISIVPAPLRQRGTIADQEFRT
jgi:hypothetical protein